MSTLPGFRRINKQDYPEDSQDLIEQLSGSLNYGIEVLYDLLNGKLSLRDNFASTIKEIDIEATATGVPKNKTVIKKNNTDRIEGLWVLNVNNLTNSNIYPTSGVLLSFTETTDSIIINHVTGLPPNNLFRIKVVAIK